MSGPLKCDESTAPAGGPGSDIVWHEGDMPYSPRFDDHYYTREDGRAECRHVFLAGNGLPERWRGRTAFTIGELGFGTGLNLVETWREWRQARLPGQSLNFVSFERFPLAAPTMARALGAWPELDDLTKRLTDRWPDQQPDGDVTIPLDGQTRLIVLVGDAEARLEKWDGLADAWFLDGFAPARNPDMWSAELMRRVAQCTASGGSLATYTAAGWVRRNLESAGFSIEKRPGHGRKREMMRGTIPATAIERPA